MRKHHGLCILFFSGRGYNKKFSSNLETVKKNLEKNNSKIHFVSENDDICKFCPLFRKGSCRDFKITNQYDLMIDSVCETIPEFISWNDYREILINNIIKTGKRIEICNGCGWNKFCSITEKEYL